MDSWIIHANLYNLINCDLLSLVFSADSWAGGTDLTGWALELLVSAFTQSALAVPPAITELSITGHTGLCVQRTIACTACVVSITDAHPAHTLTMTCYRRKHTVCTHAGIVIRYLFLCTYRLIDIPDTSPSSPIHSTQI